MGFIPGVMVHNSDPGVSQEQETVGTLRVGNPLDLKKRAHCGQDQMVAGLGYSVRMGVKAGSWD